MPKYACEIRKALLADGLESAETGLATAISKATSNQRRGDTGRLASATARVTCWQTWCGLAVMICPDLIKSVGTCCIAKQRNGCWVGPAHSLHVRWKKEQLMVVPISMISPGYSDLISPGAGGVLAVQSLASAKPRGQS